MPPPAHGLLDERVQRGPQGEYGQSHRRVSESVLVSLSGTGIALCALSRGLSLAGGSGYGIIRGRRNKRHRRSAHEGDENELEKGIVG